MHSPFLIAVALLLSSGLAVAQTRSANPEAKPDVKTEGRAKPDAKKTEAKGAETKKTEAKATPGGAKLLATHEDWGAYATGAAKTRVCYALSQPKETTPKALKREPAYIFVSTKPGEGVRNEISFILGYPSKDGGEATVSVGTAKFALLTKGSNAWVKNAAEEGRVLDAMRKGETVVVKAVRAAEGRRPGVPVSDQYSLDGLREALGRVGVECK